MSKQRAITGLAAVIVLAVLAGAVVIGLTFGAKAPAPRLGYPTSGQAAPAGCHPVAPGAWTSFCQTTSTVNAPKPSTELVCRPVAPGAFTQYCVPADQVGEPTTNGGGKTPTTVDCKPVAPGAFSEICTER